MNYVLFKKNTDLTMINPEIIIPREELPEGIILSLKNSDRYFNDSKILVGKKRLSSANTLMFFAIEEFSKAKFLIDHFKKKNTSLKMTINNILGITS